MLFRLIREKKKIAFQPFMKRSASALRLAEKELENWMSWNPELLFGAEEVLVIAQSVSSHSMADILALDAEGKLIIVEIKRDWSDRATVGQLLEYAAGKAKSNYDDLEKLYREYWERHYSQKPYVCLLDRFRELTDNPTAEKEDIPKRPQGHRICIVAPGSDEGLCRIIEWLKGYGVPISFVPFALYADTDNDTAEILLEIEPLPKVQGVGESDVGEWQGDWLFNTNETYAPGAYQKMFRQGVIAIYGYENGSANLEGSAAGQRVFAYVNKKGILAVGRIVDGQVFSDKTVFSEDREFHMKVKWETIVADDKGVTNGEVLQNYGHGLPVRNVFCRISRHSMADWIADELQRRK